VGGKKRSSPGEKKLGMIETRARTRGREPITTQGNYSGKKQEKGNR